MSATPTSESRVFVVGTLFNRRFFSIQHGWVSASDTVHLTSCLIHDRRDAEQMMKTLSSLPIAEMIGPIGIFDVELKIAKSARVFIDPSRGELETPMGNIFG